MCQVPIFYRYLKRKRRKVIQGSAFEIIKKSPILQDILLKL